MGGNFSCSIVKRVLYQWRDKAIRFVQFIPYRYSTVAIIDLKDNI